MPVIIGLLVFAAIVVVAVIGIYNSLVRLRNQVDNAWSQIDVQLKRRHDLIPNLVNTVKGYAEHEEEVLTEVTEARSRVGQIQASPDMIEDPQALANYQAAQGELTGALSRLLLVVEQYPDLKANENFRDLQAQLEGTENRIAVARNRYIQSVQEFNMTVRRFPTNLTAKIFGHGVKPTFEVEDEAALAQPPTVEFGDDN